MIVDFHKKYLFLLGFLVITKLSIYTSPGFTKEANTSLLSPAEANQWIESISNWGRWGKQDQRGTLNLITPEKIKNASSLVVEGISVSLSLDIAKTRNELKSIPFSPLKHKAYAGKHGGIHFMFDEYCIDYHGWGISHIDALNHASYREKMYNGFPLPSSVNTPLKKLGIENMSNGIVSRGVFIDIPWLMGVPYLEPGTAITIDDLSAWEKKTGILVEQGDVVIIRTGRWRYWRKFGTLDGLAGLHFSTAKWLKGRDVAVLGSDGVNDVIYPATASTADDSDIKFPLHLLALVGLGMPLIDNLDLEPVAQKADLLNRKEFLFIVSPLRITGGTGSPINAIAVF